MNNNTLALIVILPHIAAFAAETNVSTQAASSVATNFPVIVVTASRVGRPIQETPAMITHIDEKQMAENGVRSLPEMLKDDPAVRVQKTSQGQGSPYLRGFTGFRTLMLIDGIRLNNSAFRSGPNQYWNTIDCYSLAAIEVLKGPASVLYGSDAVGGTVQAFSYEPEYAEEGQYHYGSRLFTRLSSAERSVISRAQGEVATDSTAIHAGVTYKNFGDLQGGRYVGRQEKTGYTEYDYDIKARIKLAGEREIVLAWQSVEQDDIWRTHKTVYGISWQGTTIGDELARTFEQNRRLAYLQYRDDEPTWIYDTLRFTLFCQIQEEDQYAVSKPSDKKITWDGFSVVTPGFNVELMKETELGTFVYGMDYSRDIVNSYNREVTNNVSTTRVQGPIADDSSYDLAGLFVEDRIPLGDHFEVTPGIRGTYAHARVGDYYAVAPGIEKTEKRGQSFDKTWYDASANLRLAYYATDDRSLMFYTGLGQAFRAPNLSDMSSYRASKSKTYEMSSPNVDPEHYLTYEIGSKWTKDGLTLQAAWYYTWMRDQITAVYEKNGTDILSSSANSGQGYVQGAEIDGAYEITKNWVIRGGIAWSEGYADTYYKNSANQITTVSDDNFRTAPLAGFAALRWQTSDKKIFVEFTNQAVAPEDRLTYSEAHNGDTQRVPPQGTPGYYVAGLRAGWQICEYANMGVAIDNLLDKDYRVHGSGNNEAGRNFIISLELRF
jgi:hemoglobin/transferrin/lactoferrin receptor protein